MRVLAIETSCDETAVAIVSEQEGKFIVEKNLVSSQMQTHAKYGGVVPEVAARMHMESLFPVLKEAGVSRRGEDIDAIAVTQGPGLVVALRVGVECAKTLAHLWQKPLVAVNHLEGHVASAWLGQETPLFPLLALIVSGGHTEWVLFKSFIHRTYLGGTRDDAAGEAFDKVAKLLGLGYPGGPALSQLAEGGSSSAIAFPRPMMDADTLEVSFSGLKTAVRRVVHDGAAAPHSLADIAASFEEAVVDTLARKTAQAIRAYAPASLTVVGGVSANRPLRERLNVLAASHRLPLLIPELKFCTDNAAMIGVAGLLKAREGLFVDPLTLESDPHLSLV
ncbi:tRNA (adenosine(37)-N6)-threonylcarbamoyltransferase complex transferase subunit TsaD [Candidatus Uhrbacteria bacterium]|nr:tRNA (adenosine(37)-N6)-threonylcarbamoyltransferase complex transferase subunit TsaD [Candidatus Uhrbacteria bacterium]